MCMGLFSQNHRGGEHLEFILFLVTPDSMTLRIVPRVYRYTAVFLKPQRRVQLEFILFLVLPEPRGRRQKEKFVSLLKIRVLLDSGPYMVNIT